MKNLLFTILTFAFALSLRAQIIYVTPAGSGLKDGTSWANALDGNFPSGNGYTKLADSMRLAASGKQFWIAEGTYKPCTDDDREKYFYILQNVDIYGGFAGNETNVNERNFQLHKSVFSGNIGLDTLDTDNSYHVLATSGVTWSVFSTLDGVTIIQGYAGNSNYSNSDWRNYGGAVYNGHKLKLINDEFLNCYADQGGGAVYNGKTIEIENSLFYKNYAASGGGVSITYSSDPAILQATITSCTFSNNSAWANGGAISTGGVSKVINCLIVNNSASNGGGIYCGGVVNMNNIETQIINSTIANNSSDILFSYGSAKIHNSVIWGSTITTWNNPTLDFKYSCIQDTVSGLGMLYTNPFFVNPTLNAGTSYDGLEADWRLRWCSPIPDMAADSLIPEGITTDIDGNPRILLGSVDMGAYEYDTTGTNPNVVGFSNNRIYVSNDNVYLGDGASWSTALAGNAESCIYQGQNMLYEAMKDAVPGTEIWIKGGVYKSSLYLNRNHSFTVGDGVKVFGSFAGNETSVDQRNIQLSRSVFSGNIADTLVDSDNSVHVMSINSEEIVYADTAIVDGVIIEKGYANGADGAGILVNTNSKVRFNNIEVINNTTQANGAGIKINANARISILNSNIAHNSGCGIYNLGKLTVSNSTIKHNNYLSGVSGIYNADSLVLNYSNIDSNYNDSHASAGGGLVNAGHCVINGGSVNGNRTFLQGGGIWNKTGAGLLIFGCNIAGNLSPSGGGIYNDAGATCTVSQTTIASNSDGGGIYNNGLLNIEGGKISNNTTTGSGGGIYNPTIVKNCIVVNNTKTNTYKTGGGIWIGTGCQGIFNSTIMNNSGEGLSAAEYDGMHHLILNPDTFLIRNSIIYGNDIQISGNYNIYNSCIAGSAIYNNNSWYNPHCVDPTIGKGIDYNGLSADWNLLGCSPCINEGDNTFLTDSDTLDAAGNPRIQFNAVDIGALELQTPAFGGDCPPGISHNIIWEIFTPKPANVQTTTGAPNQSIFLPTLETDFSGDLSAVSRLRGYILPPVSGFYKFYLAADAHASLYLSSDTTEYRIHAICATGNVGNYNWPSNPEITDSTYLESGKFYYFESFCTNYLKIGWVLPGNANLQVISADYVRQANPKQSTGVNLEIFKNRLSYDFNILKNTGEIPDEISRLDSIIAIDHSTLLDRFSSRIRGYLIPPVSGNYSFYFNCVDAGQFWLSPDTSATNAQLKSEISTMQGDSIENISAQELIAGQKYFFEILHYDTIYTDLIKLRWILPGDTLPNVIKTPYIMSCGANVPVGIFSLFDHKLIAYPDWTIPVCYYLSPWNASYKNVKWISSNEAVATIDAEGVIHTVSPGICQIIAKVVSDTTLADSLTLAVTNYNVPFYVQAAISGNGDGHSWDNAIDLGSLLGDLKQGTLLQEVTIYVAEGIYKPTTTIDRNKTFEVSNIRLVGGFSASSTGIDTTNRDIINHETILSGEIGVPGATIDNSYHVVTATKSVIIDGLTITDGRASSYSYGFVSGYYNPVNDNRGGGISIPGIKSVIRINNCKIKNNSAWDRGGGIYCHSASNTIDNSSSVTIQNSEFFGNLMEQDAITTGGIFVLVINCSGGAIAANCSRLNISGSKFYNNTARGYGNALYMHLGAEAIIENCSFYDNPGDSEDLFVKDGGIIILNNSTIDGSLSALSANLEMSNSTITGGGYFYGFSSSQFMKLDNVIWPGGRIAHEDEEIGVINVVYSIFKNRLYGNNFQTVIVDSVSPYTTWLDSLAYNGGPTPTMKLKNIPGNYALNYGNPLYLDSTDQRGAIRANFVSIGAYQWVDATEIVISPHQLTLTLGDSADFSVYFLPAFSSDGLYAVTCSDNNIARLDSSMIYALTPGFVNIIAQSSDGMLRDTLLCQVIDNAGIEEVNANSQFRIFPNPVAHELTIASKGNTGMVNYEVLNILGQVVSNGFFTEQTVINMSDLLPGAYLIKCTTDKTVEVMKILKD